MHEVPAEVNDVKCNWLCCGQAIFPALLEAIDAARRSVLLEIYIYSPGPLGEKFRDALIRARRRGVEVRVMIDALGSMSLPGSYLDPLRDAGAEVRRFNPLRLNRLSIRDHRKLLVCDRQVAFVGGFNIAPEYEGDGVTSGWCDLGIRLEGRMAEELARAFEDMFDRADLQHKGFLPLRRFGARRTISVPREQLLLSGPGRGRNPIKSELRRDLARARNVQIMVAYFLPSWRLRRSLVRVARSGGRVQLLLAGKSDVVLSLLAAQSLYRRFLKTGVEIFEYQPQILHAKLFIIDDVVYVGSANLDHRSLNLNYELMIRFEDSTMAGQARELFRKNLEHCHPITWEKWSKSRTLWSRLKQRWAYFFLARIDPFVAQRQWRRLPDK
jgi:cardiolipin synthase